MGRRKLLSPGLSCCHQLSQELGDVHRLNPLLYFCPCSCSPWGCLGKSTDHAAPKQHHLLLHCTPKSGHKQCHFCLTSQAAAVGRVYFSAIYFESPAPRDVYVGCFLNIDNVWGSGAWDAEKVGEISTIEASLNQREREQIPSPISAMGKRCCVSSLLCSPLSASSLVLTALSGGFCFQVV